MFRRSILLPWGLLLLAPACVISGGQEPEAELFEEHEEWERKPHHFAVLTGGTFESTDTAATVGLDYEYRTSDHFGFGVVAEHAFADIKVTTLLGSVEIHLTEHWIIQTGPGVEFFDEEEGVEEEFVYRFGLMYEWERVSGFTVSPQIHYDLSTGEDAIILGLAIGKSF